MQCLALKNFDWVATLVETVDIDLLFHLQDPETGIQFEQMSPGFYCFSPAPPIQLLELDLRRIRVVTSSGNLRTTTIDPDAPCEGADWALGTVRSLKFDPQEWKWKEM